MNETQLVSYKIISSEGHTVEEKEAQLALEEIRELVDSESKWLFLNKEHIADLSDLTIETLIDAEDIMLTNLQVGG